MNSAILLTILISICIGYFWGTHTTKKYYSKNFKLFSDELNKQYQKCIEAVEKKYQIKIDWRGIKTNS